MVGKPQFDDVAVVNAAVEVFWRHGYAAASISDLTDATRLSRSSLYQRFRDKDGLFLEALEAYTEYVVQCMRSAAGASPRARLEALLRSFLPNAVSPARPAGCLIARSCAEMLDLPAAGRKAALASAERLREIFASLLREGVARGELPKNADVDAMAWHYYGVLQAVRNLPLAGADRGALERMITAALSAWTPLSSSRQRRKATTKDL
jgi:AcrR family transcriptional regulator